MAERATCISNSVYALHMCFCCYIKGRWELGERVFDEKCKLIKQDSEGGICASIKALKCGPYWKRI